jgi:hypothetical protein
MGKLKKTARAIAFRPDKVIDDGLGIAQIVKDVSVSEYIRGALYDRMRSDGFVECHHGQLAVAARFKKILPAAANLRDEVRA